MEQINFTQALITLAGMQGEVNLSLRELAVFVDNIYELLASAQTSGFFSEDAVGIRRNIGDAQAALAFIKTRLDGMETEARKL